MPTSTIPYDPSLVLGMVVNKQKIEELEEIANLQKPVDNARNKVNALLRQKLSLDMTVRELSSLGATSEQLNKIQVKIGEIMESIIKSTEDLSSAVMDSEEAIAQLKSNQGQKQISSQVESPIDFSASQLQSLPISSDSMNMDVQYFRYEENEESATNTANSISSFVGAKVSSFFGPSVGVQAAASTHTAVSEAKKGRSIIGTVVILINCTHKQAKVFSPVQLDVENAIENYASYMNKPWTTTDPESMAKIANQAIQAGNDKNSMPVLTGASYGSSFVGFVNFEKIERTQSRQAAESAAYQASVEIERGLFAEQSLNVGIDRDTAQSVKNLLSTSDIMSHCSVITMGLIPSIKSNEVTSTVAKLQGSPKDYMDQLATMQEANSSGMVSVAARAEQARKGNAIEQMKADFVRSAVSAVDEVATAHNKVIDMNSLMTALDDFVERANQGDGGVPINFYIKYVTDRTIARQWLQKYYPDFLRWKKEDKDS